MTFAHVLTYLAIPCALSKTKMAGKDDVNIMEYSTVTKIQKSEALLVRQCNSCLSLTLWLVSILIYTQEFHHSDAFFVCYVSCHVAVANSKSKYHFAFNTCTPRNFKHLNNSTNFTPMNFSANTHNYDDLLFHLFADCVIPSPQGANPGHICASH